MYLRIHAVYKVPTRVSLLLTKSKFIQTSIEASAYFFQLPEIK